MTKDQPPTRNGPSFMVMEWCKLHGVLPPAPDVLDAFENEMRGKQYGFEETWDAFCWFRNGWLARTPASEIAPIQPDPERVAQLIAHRVCCGVEHDTANGKLHGYCVVCGVPWPCEYAGKPPQQGYLDVVFDGPPNHESGRFVEVEDETGKSINAGEWIDRKDGLWALRIKR